MHVDTIYVVTAQLCSAIAGCIRSSLRFPLAVVLTHTSTSSSSICERLFPFTSARPVSRSAMLVGSCIAWSMESSQMVRYGTSEFPYPHGSVESLNIAKLE